mgnify:CR=1 FL=1
MINDFKNLLLSGILTLENVSKNNGCFNMFGLRVKRISMFVVYKNLGMFLPYRVMALRHGSIGVSIICEAI